MMEPFSGQEASVLFFVACFPNSTEVPKLVMPLVGRARAVADVLTGATEDTPWTAETVASLRKAAIRRKRWCR